MMRRALSMLVAVSSFGLVGPAAHATYPGRNGRIAFTVLHYHPGGPATFTAASVTPAGRERRALGPIADVSWSATGRRLVAITPSSAPLACPTCGTGTTLVLADARVSLQMVAEILAAVRSPSGGELVPRVTLGISAD